MATAFRLLFVPALIALGWYLARCSRIWSRRTWFILNGASLGLVVTILLAGLLHESNALKSWHRWGAHALVILLWSSTPMCIGIAIAHWMGQRPALAFILVVLVLSSFAVAVMASMTGYLGPSHGSSLPKSLNRFHVLHKIVLPVILVGLLTGLVIAGRALSSENRDAAG